MADIGAELGRVQDAFARPTLALLHQQQAPVVVALLRACFDQNHRQVPTARLHTLVATHLDDLRAAGEKVPAGSGRDLCQRWVRDQWLSRDPHPEDGETYSLTSQAQDALRLVGSLTRERGGLSEHRIATIVNTVRQFNAQVNPSVSARLAILEDQIAVAAAERDKLLNGGDLPPVDADDLVAGFSNLLALIGALPSDFTRVQEAFDRMRADVLASFRQEDRPAGQVVRQYLEQVDALTLTTAEGRAFEGALVLLRDNVLLDQLSSDLGDLLHHPQAGDLLLESERRELLGVVSLIRRGLAATLEHRARVTRALREHIRQHNPAQDRQVDDVLRTLDAQLRDWMARTGPRTSVPLPLLPPETLFPHLRTDLYDPADHTPAPQLRDVSEHRPPDVLLADVTATGGPDLGGLQAAMAAAFATDTDPGNLAAMFAHLPDPMRRTVEVMALLQLADNSEHLTRTTGPAHRYAATEADGSPAPLLGPAVITTPTEQTP